jgi:hypothetical protein
MNILIENNETNEYLTEQGDWTRNPLKGKIFNATAVAFRAARQEPLRKFNIVFHLPQNNQFVNLDHGHGKGAAVETGA